MTKIRTITTKIRTISILIPDKGTQVSFIMRFENYIEMNQILLILKWKVISEDSLAKCDLYSGLL